MWETAFDVTDTTFDCNVNRTKGDPTQQLYLINHFLDKPSVFGLPAPDVGNAAKTNAANGTGSLGLQVETCSAQYGRAPNFLLVDVSDYHLIMTGRRGVPFRVSPIRVCISTPFRDIGFAQIPAQIPTYIYNLSYLLGSFCYA